MKRSKNKEREVSGLEESIRLTRNVICSATC